MSYYLSHLANLALNQLDVVQPRLASRFENHGDATAPSPVSPDAHEFHVQQDVISETAAPVMNRTVAQGKQSIAPDQLNNRPLNKPPGYEPQSAAVIASPKQTPSVVPVEPTFQLSQSTQKPQATQELAIPQAELPKPTLQAPQSQEPAKTELPLLSQSNSKALGMESAKPEFKEEVIETSLPLLTSAPSLMPLPLLTSAKVQRATSAMPIDNDIQPTIFSSQPRFQPEPIFADKPRRQELIPAQETPNSQPLAVKSTQNTEQATKSAAVKPESIRIQPLQPDFTGRRAYSDQPIATAPVDITPPSINVSIGRIEIRASQTTAPAAAKPRASSTMSLDDYLKQRGGKP